MSSLENKHIGCKYDAVFQFLNADLKHRGLKYYVLKAIICDFFFLVNSVLGKVLLSPRDLILIYMIFLVFPTF